MNTLSYELAKELKEAGFVLDVTDSEVEVMGEMYRDDRWYLIEDRWYRAPTLEELIEACGEQYFKMGHGKDDPWYASRGYEHETIAYGTTPEEAVARLLLCLMKHHE